MNTHIHTHIHTLLPRYHVQIDVLQQLGAKLETNLQQQEQQLATTARTEAAKRRATLVKLNRDFRRVEAVYKNMVLDTKRARAVRAQNKLQQNAMAREQQQEDTSQPDQQMQLELQLQQEVSVSVLCQWNVVLCVLSEFSIVVYAQPLILSSSETQRRNHARA